MRMKLIKYLNKEYNKDNYKNWVTDGKGFYYSNIADYLTDYMEQIKESLNPKNVEVLNYICNGWVDWEQMERDLLSNGELYYLDDLNLEQDEVNEYGELL